MKLYIRSTLVTLSSLLLGASNIQADEGANVSFTFRSQTGKIDGYLQTPDGGMPGRTDRHRPTFSELDIDDTENFALELNVESGRNIYRTSATLMRLEEQLTLDRPLMSQWTQFDAGEEVKTEIKFDQYRFVFFRSFELSAVSGLHYSLGADIVGMDFHYQLYNGDKKVDRSYMKAGFRLGGTLNYLLSNRLSVGVEVFDSIPFPNTVELRYIDVLGRYSLWKKHTTCTVEFGVSYFRLVYQDEQEVPNHLQVETGPMLRLGITVSI